MTIRSSDSNIINLWVARQPSSDPRGVRPA